MNLNEFESKEKLELSSEKMKPINLICNLYGREFGTFSNSLYVSSDSFSFNRGYANRNETTMFNQLKSTYLSITPNLNILNVKVPNCHIRRFSPDGRYLIAFSHSLTKVHIFTFSGCSAGSGRLDQASGLSNERTDRIYSMNLENQQTPNMFDTYFKELAQLKLTTSVNEMLNRECLLFFNNSYLICASTQLVDEDSLPPYGLLAPNNEAIHYGSIENYTFYLVNISAARVCDTLKFQADKLNLVNNQSICLFKNQFAVLSIQNQTISLYELRKSIKNTTENYQFVPIQNIGRFCLPDDLDYLRVPRMFESAQTSSASSSSINNRQKLFKRDIEQMMLDKPYMETCLTGMKQRLLTYFYKEAMQTNTVSQFYWNIHHLLNLKMFKMQFLDECHVLIKCANIEHILNKPASSSSRCLINAGTQPGTDYSPAANRSDTINAQLAPQANLQQVPDHSTLQPTGLSARLNASLSENTLPFYLVFYNVRTARIVKIFTNTSNELFQMYENFLDYFSLSSLDQFSYDYPPNGSHLFGNTFQFQSFCSNSTHARQLLKSYLNRIAKTCSALDLSKCILSHLPMSSQAFTWTPYLNCELFNYDEKLISNWERAKPIGDVIIKFTRRDSGRVSFRMCTGDENSVDSRNQNIYRKFVTFVWHPREPFCMSMKPISSEQTACNFHVPNK